MYRMLRILSAFAFAAMATTSTVSAQSKKFFSVAAGATMPMGADGSDDYGAYAKTGWMGGVGLGTGIGSGNMFLMANLSMGKNSHDGDGAGSTTLTGVGANIGFASPGDGMHFYGYAGGGIMQHKYNPDGGGSCDDCSDSKPYVNGAVGVSFPMGKNRFFVQGGMTTRLSEDEGEGTTKFMAFMAGLRIGF